MLAPEEVAVYRDAFERLEPHLTGPRMGQAHLHFRWAYDLATEDRILDAAEQLIGPDVLVHSTTLFCKRPHDGAFVSWHQDAYNWRLDAPRLVTAWVALSDSTAENGCLRVIPGSHTARLEHEARPHRDNMLRVTGLTVSDRVDESRAVDFVLSPGEMSLHHADLVHGSRPNESEISRIGFAIRYVSPSVQQESEHHRVVLARGEDGYGHYDLLDEPPSSDQAQGLAAHHKFWA